VTSLDGPDAAPHRGVLDVDQAHNIDLYGDDDNALLAADVIKSLTPNPDSATAWAVASVDDEVVGFASLTTPLQDNLSLAEISVVVHPAHRRQGIGTQLLGWVDDHARQCGRTTLQTWTSATPPVDGTPTVQAPTGDVFPASPGYLFADANGFTLEQVERTSLLHLPMDVTALRDDAQAHATGYALHTWLGIPPDEWLDGFAALRAQFSIDAPFAGLDFEKTIWDEDRIRRDFERNDASGYQQLTVAAEHIASGRLVAYTEVYWHATHPDCLFQGCTLVLDGHRGHRLGMLLKTTLMDALPAHNAAADRIYTDNAGENAWMLAINQTLGYQPHSLEGAVQKKLTA